MLKLLIHDWVESTKGRGEGDKQEVIFIYAALILSVKLLKRTENAGSKKTSRSPDGYTA